MKRRRRRRMPPHAPPEVEIDDREDAYFLRNWPATAHTLKHRLQFGDFAFIGNGPPKRVTIGDEPRGDKRVTVGIERKTLGDFWSSICSARLQGHQLPGLVRSYDYPFLLIEGSYRLNPVGQILQHGGKHRVAAGPRVMTADIFNNLLNSISIVGGVPILFSSDKRDTITVVECLRRWFAKPWKSHKTFMAFPSTIPTSRNGAALFVAPNLVAKVAAQLPGIGAKRALDVAAHFATVDLMVAATPAQWESIEGIGKGIAENVCKKLGDPRA